VTALYIVMSVMCGWIVLTLLGSERHRQMTLLEIQRRAEERRQAEARATGAAKAAAAAPPAAPAHNLAEH
jgi:hypothetical protein